MLKGLKTNNRGIVFVTVLIMTIIAMILAVSVLSLNVSQVKSSEDEIKYIQAAAVSEGSLAQILISKITGSTQKDFTFCEVIGNTTYMIIGNIDSSGSGPIGSNSVPLTIDVTF